MTDGMPSCALGALLCLGLGAAAAVAENALTALPSPADRPYPYEILGLQPGDPFEDVAAIFTERSEDAPTSETETFRVQSPEGVVFSFAYQRFSRIGDIGIQGRLANAPEDQVTAFLSSGVLDQRPLIIHRSLRQPSDTLPEPLALRAQLEESYGPASRVSISGQRMEILYAWSTDGFVTDLDARAPLIHEKIETFAGRTSSTISNYEICGNASHYENTVTYRFKYPREKDIKPGCVATFKVTYEGGPDSTRIVFAITDYDLARQHMIELDRQIIDGLTQTAVAPSNLDL